MSETARYDYMVQTEQVIEPKTQGYGAEIPIKLDEEHSKPLSEDTIKKLVVLQKQLETKVI